MHVQSHFNQPDVAVIHALIKAQPLGALVMQGAEGLEVNHMPFLLLPDASEQGVLQTHIPLGNAIRTFPDQEALVLFQGPQAYISPNWYPSKREHGKAVPTWNYVVAHAYGRPRFIRDRHWLHQHVTALTTVHEAGRADPWHVNDAPADYLEQMLARIVGVELVITRLVGKWKVSQNRPLDRPAVASALETGTDAMGLAMAALIRDNTD